MDVASENITLPLARGALGRSGIGTYVATSLPGAGPYKSEAEEQEEARLYAKLTSRSQNHIKYFASKRKEQLLLDAAIRLTTVVSASSLVDIPTGIDNATIGVAVRSTAKYERSQAQVFRI
ncbi:unnamed protein product [Hydatigera taeniaeformis]|uniref:Ysc84 domain-containing protein n=1 Tax=Hydatigena taeniaeformis TaxID=6205 RepID=A0A0R3WR89_HYDTA|nr:unnamed protein product [Hydatigera taeniaeformis]